MTDTQRPSVPAPATEREFTVKARSQWQLVLRRFMHHRLALAALVVLVLLVVTALVGGRVWKFTYEDKDLEALSQGPSWDHPMGTDGIGKDQLAQVLRGAQKSVQIMLMVAFGSTMVGVVIGAVAGYFRGIVDTLLMRAIDVILTIPFLALVAVLAGRYQSTGSTVGIAVIIAAFSWTSLARVVRAEFLSLREKEFVEAARAIGASDRRIIFRHILPNVVGSIIVSATLTMASAILAETALSFLGLGVKPPDTSLGVLVAEAATSARTRPWLFYFPGFVIIVIVLCVNFVGDGLRDAFDPKQTRVRA